MKIAIRILIIATIIIAVANNAMLRSQRNNALRVAIESQRVAEKWEAISKDWEKSSHIYEEQAALNLKTMLEAVEVLKTRDKLLKGDASK